MRYILSLGSSLGNREDYLKKAVRKLQQKGKVVSSSLVYETEPVETVCRNNFYNACILYETELEPEALLEWTESIEKELGRTGKEKKECRTIDIDILLLEDTIYVSKRLKIPHERLRNRRFFLVPLIEIASTWKDPVTGEEMKGILDKCKDRGKVWKTGISLV